MTEEVVGGRVVVRQRGLGHRLPSGVDVWITPIDGGGAMVGFERNGLSTELFFESEILQAISCIWVNLCCQDPATVPPRELPPSEDSD